MTNLRLELSIRSMDHSRTEFLESYLEIKMNASLSQHFKLQEMERVQKNGQYNLTLRTSLHRHNILKNARITQHFKLQELESVTKIASIISL